VLKVYSWNITQMAEIVSVWVIDPFDIALWEQRFNPTVFVLPADNFTVDCSKLTVGYRN
jgi:hypothetical protein